MLKNFKGAIFDLDGTLIDSGKFPDLLWTKAGKEYLGVDSFRLTGEEDKATRTMTLTECANFIRERYPFGKDADELFEFMRKAMIDFYTNEVVPKEGVAEFLDYCLASNIKMCIASATRKPEILLAVKRCGFEKYFPVILSCADIGKGKTSPDIFIEAQKELGTKTEETWVFEDSLTAIKTAKGIGLNTVGIYDSGNFGHEEMERISDIYIAHDETLKKLINQE